MFPPRFLLENTVSVRNQFPVTHRLYLTGFSEGVTFMRECMDAPNLHRRLNKILGQVKAIDKMVDEDVPCEEILIQINAVKGAIHRVGQIVLEGHLQHCVKEGIENGDAEETIKKFADAVEHFTRRS